MGNQPSGRSEMEMDCALTNYIEDTVRNHLQFKESDEEINAIKTAVENMVDDIMREVRNDDFRFEMLRIIPIGSMAEGTRIVKPDEFDFMVVMKHLSYQDDVDINRDKTICNGYGVARVHLRNNETSKTWKDICDDFNLRSTKNTRLYRQIMYKLFGNQEKLGLKEVFRNNVKTAVKLLLKYGHKSATNYGILSLKNSIVEIHGPAVTAQLHWYSFGFRKYMTISVDLVAVIESDNRELVKAEDAISPATFQELQETGRVHLIPTGRLLPCRKGLCFQITYSETETRRINSLNQNHKICCQILKAMFKTRYAMASHLNMTYVIKMLILEHGIDCAENEMAGQCLMKI